MRKIDVYEAGKFPFLGPVGAGSHYIFLKTVVRSDPERFFFLKIYLLRVFCAKRVDLNRMNFKQINQSKYVIQQ